MKIVREHINEKFTEDSDPIDDLGLGRPRYARNIYNKFQKDLEERFDGLQDIYFKEEENFYIDIPLDYYTDYGMNVLDRTIKKLIKEKYKGKLKIIDDKFLERYYKNEWPDESPFYNGESIMIKIL